MWPGAQRAWCYWPKTCSWICIHGKHSQWGGEEWNRIDWLVDQSATIAIGPSSHWGGKMMWLGWKVVAATYIDNELVVGGRLVVTMVENIPALSALHPRIRWTFNSLKPILLSKNLTLPWAVKICKISTKFNSTWRFASRLNIATSISHVKLVWTKICSQTKTYLVFVTRTTSNCGEKSTMWRYFSTWHISLCGEILHEKCWACSKKWQISGLNQNLLCGWWITTGDKTTVSTIAILDPLVI